MLLVSRFITGGVSGIIETIAFAYVSEREQEYKNAYLQLLQQDLRKTQKKVKLPNIKEKTFTFLTLSLTLAYLLGPGKMPFMPVFLYPCASCTLLSLPLSLPLSLSLCYRHECPYSTVSICESVSLGGLV